MILNKQSIILSLSTALKDIITPFHNYNSFFYSSPFASLFSASSASNFSRSSITSSNYNSALQAEQRTLLAIFPQRTFASSTSAPDPIIAPANRGV